MKLYIKARDCDNAPSYTILDENMQTKYSIQYDALLDVPTLKLFDITCKELGVVKKEGVESLSEFYVYTQGSLKGIVKKRFTLFRDKYELEYREWHVIGDFLAWDYDIYSHCSAEVHIRKKLLEMVEFYEIEIDYPEDELDALLLVLAIAMANRGK